MLEESVFARSEEREVETFNIGGWGTKTVCDGFGESAQKKEGFVGSLVVSPKGFGPDAGEKQKPMKECDSSGLWPERRVRYGGIGCFFNARLSQVFAFPKLRDLGVKTRCDGKRLKRSRDDEVIVRKVDRVKLGWW